MGKKECLEGMDFMKTGKHGVQVSVTLSRRAGNTE